MNLKALISLQLVPRQSALNGTVLRPLPLSLTFFYSQTFVMQDLFILFHKIFMKGNLFSALEIFFQLSVGPSNTNETFVCHKPKRIERKVLLCFFYDIFMTHIEKLLSFLLDCC